LSPFIHGSVPYLCAAAAGLDERGRRWTLVAGMAADLDALGVVFSEQGFRQAHHTWGHSIPFAVAVGVLCWLLSRERRWRGPLLCLGAAMSHLVFDYVGSNWGIALWWPLSRARMPELAWLNNQGVFLAVNGVASVLTLGGIFWCAHKMGHTPIEAFWPALDSLMLGSLHGFFHQRCHVEGCPHRAFAVCRECGEPACSIHTKVSPGLHPICSACLASGKGTGRRLISARCALVCAMIAAILLVPFGLVLLKRLLF